jgi:hypothetical protein
MGFSLGFTGGGGSVWDDPLAWPTVLPPSGQPKKSSGDWWKILDVGSDLYKSTLQYNILRDQVRAGQGFGQAQAERLGFFGDFAGAGAGGANILGFLFSPIGLVLIIVLIVLLKK